MRLAICFAPATEKLRLLADLCWNACQLEFRLRCGAFFQQQAELMLVLHQCCNGDAIELEFVAKKLDAEGFALDPQLNARFFAEDANLDLAAADLTVLGALPVGKAVVTVKDLGLFAVTQYDAGLRSSISLRFLLACFPCWPRFD